MPRYKAATLGQGTPAPLFPPPSSEPGPQSAFQRKCSMSSPSLFSEQGEGTGWGRGTSQFLWAHRCGCQRWRKTVRSSTCMRGKETSTKDRDCFTSGLLAFRGTFPWGSQLLCHEPALGVARQLFQHRSQTRSIISNDWFHLMVFVVVLGGSIFKTNPKD